MSTISQQVFGIIKLSTKVTVTFWSRIWVQKPNLTWEHEQSKVPLNASLLVILSDSCEQNKIKSCPKTDKPLPTFRIKWFMLNKMTQLYASNVLTTN